MALIVMTSATGAPGLTTTALGLTLTWPRDIMLVDADREPAQALQAGYLRGMDVGGRGLSVLPGLHRENRPLAPQLHQHSLPLTGADDPQRRFLPGFSHPGAVRLFDPIWPELSSSLAGLGEHGVDVILDVGSIGREGLPLSLLAEADAVCVVTRTSLRALASLRLYLPLLQEQLSSLPVERPLGLLLVGAGRPYGAAEITAQFGVTCWDEIPFHERHAAVLSDGADEPRRFEDTTLMNQYRVISTHLTERLAAERELRRQLTARLTHV